MKTASAREVNSRTGAYICLGHGQLMLSALSASIDCWSISMMTMRSDACAGFKYREKRSNDLFSYGARISKAKRTRQTAKDTEVRRTILRTRRFFFGT